ncbi:Rad1/Rec1/Rad17 [Mycotypha africana]|uniref:Rad1/Rec1/Rad17 n=1 Tax=Mycotypha africana TaxID=64632 RepID=UPI002301CBBB|nr:Rad1/Rec1/Rad17 [Mycotypha africana]KAI8987511.1 Rad1/Rec1/Rad17 [Mycotypha africana]
MDYTIEENVQFYGVIKNVKHLLVLLKAINIQNIVSIWIHEEGMVLTVENHRSVKAIAFLKLHLFHIFNFTAGIEIPTFALPLDAITTGLRTIIPKERDTVPSSQALSDYCEIKYNGTGSNLSLFR